MATTKPTPIRSSPGIRRDGTQFDGEEYTAGTWCRFYRGRPKKMNGYNAVTSSLPELVYGMNSFTSDGTNFLPMGSATKVTQARVNQFGNLVGLDDRTPGAPFVNDVNNIWQMDTFISAVGGPNSLVAHAAPNLDDISSSTERNIFAGDVTGVGALAAIGMDANSGGIVSIYPYLFGYGNNGRLDISAPNNYATNDSAFVTGQKIVKGLPLRNAGGPAGLFWSLDSLIQAIFNPAILTGIPFSFNTVSGQSSMLSSQGALEYDGIYFWMGVDRFLMFNGVVREVPNQFNLNFFFDNINFQFRQKAFAFKVPRWGEIWFCAPLGNSVECNHAIIYNIREGYWYDTPLPSTGRTNGIFASVYQKPFMTDLLPDATTGLFTLWQHETGLDQINNTNIQPILSSFTTSETDMIDKGVDKALRVDFVEPDLVQAGDLTMTVVGRSNARASDQDSQSVTFPDLTGAPLDADEQIVRFKKSYRLLRFTVTSNDTGGDYYMGKTIAHIEPVDGRVTQ